MGHTILIIVGGWLALDALFVAFLYWATSGRQERAGSRADVAEALGAACPIRREREVLLSTARERRRFRQASEETAIEYPPAVSAGTSGSRPPRRP
jgi:hypothetical protein